MKRRSLEAETEGSRPGGRGPFFGCGSAIPGKGRLERGRCGHRPRGFCRSGPMGVGGRKFSTGFDRQFCTVFTNRTDVRIFSLTFRRFCGIMGAEKNLKDKFFYAACGRYALRASAPIDGLGETPLQASVSPSWWNARRKNLRDMFFFAACGRFRGLRVLLPFPAFLTLPGGGVIFHLKIEYLFFLRLAPSAPRPPLFVWGGFAGFVAFLFCSWHRTNVLFCAVNGEGPRPRGIARLLFSFDKETL